jgi:hypothetical protein
MKTSIFPENNQQITDFAVLLDRMIFAHKINGQPPTVGLVVASLGTLLASKPTNPENLERMIADMVRAIRAGFQQRTDL